MSRTIRVPNGIVTFIESKAKCPHCKRHIHFEEIEPKWEKSKNGYIKMKCKCKRFIGVTCNIMGDFVAYEL